jgi:ADP-heptose:LPS heptosyltransferase
MRLLVIRNSSMGDVALTLPALRAITGQYPDVDILMLTNLPFKPFFNRAEHITVFAADFKHRYKGLPGLVRLFIDLSVTGRFDHVIDLHDVLRSKVLRTFFRLRRVPVTIIDKGREEKNELVTGRSREKLKHSVIRYLDTFRRAGFNAEPGPGPWIIPSSENIMPGILSDDPSINNIGVAPYAKHLLKMWPEDYVLALLSMISENFKSRIIFFGGPEDAEKLKNLTTRIPGSVSVAGRLSLDTELAIISRLDMMIAMDSSNMHLAALSGVKVISVWGGTDPVSGFGAWMQPEKYFLRIPFERLECRPCTVYGAGDCKRGDLACLKWLTPDIVYNTITGLKILR